jgi:hypothetical protein
MLFDVDDNENYAFPFDILEKAPNLQGMAILRCSNPRIFQQAQNSYNSEQKILEQLKILTLHSVSKLQCIGLEEPFPKTVYEKLHYLNVIHCLDLTKLFHFPSVVSFSCLTHLRVEECHQLEYLFTSSMATMLKHLGEIVIKDCRSIRKIVEEQEGTTTQVVEKEQEGTTSKEIKFEWLYLIHLDSLSNLECFYSGNDTLQLPALIQVDIRQCPKMEFFSRKEINANSFRGIQASIDYSLDELVFHNDVNASVKRVFLLQVGTSTQSINYELNFCMIFMSSNGLDRLR